MMAGNTVNMTSNSYMLHAAIVVVSPASASILYVDTQGQLGTFGFVHANGFIFQNNSLRILK